MEVQKLRTQCHQLVPWILVNRNWKLIQDEVAFIEEVITEVQHRLSRMRLVSKQQLTLEKVIEQATINRYNHYWYTACRANDALQQARAFTELYNYMYSIARFKAHANDDLIQESTQIALVNVWRNLEQVKDPGAFMRYAAMVVTREVHTQMIRVQGRVAKEISTIDLAHPEDDSEAATTAVISEVGISPPPEEIPSPLTEIEYANIRATIRNCLKRSEERQAIIIGRFLQEKSVKELVDELGLLPQEIHLQTHRALAALRKCSDFLHLLENLSWRIAREA